MALDSPAGNKVDAVIENLEKRYFQASFSADFFQKSIIKALNISDVAHGKGFFKSPGKMRWEYTSPEKQTIISDGETLWIYQPEDRQVMVGDSASFFGGGKGGGFLMFIQSMKARFTVLSETLPSNDFYTLKLTPIKKDQEIEFIRLLISKKTDHLFKISTRMIYGDETVITMKNIKFGETFDDSIFNFAIPEGLDVIKMD